MAIGNSGRIVIDLAPEQKKLIHTAIRAQGKNLRQWFLEHVEKDFPDMINSTNSKKKNSTCKK